MLVETKPYSNRKVVIPGRLEIHAADDAARFILRIAPAKLALAEKALGAKFPAKIGDLTRSGDIAVACIGPDEWYIWAEEARARPSRRLLPSFMRPNRIALLRSAIAKQVSTFPAHRPNGC